METPILAVNKVTKRFGGLTAIDNVSFSIPQGSAFGLMGPNGAGKTTIISIISGQYKPDLGSIVFEGRDISGLPSHSVCRLGVARTYQIPHPFASLTVLDNVVIPAMYGQGLNKTSAMQEAYEVLDIVNLTDKTNMLAGNLEALTLKRLELARALASKPKLLLIDEVAAGLTDLEIPGFLDILKRIQALGITFIMIEHVLKVMLEAVDHVVVIDSGIKIAEGTPNEVMKDEKVISAYLG